MTPEGTLLLRRQEVAALLGVEECIAAVEEVFKLYAEGKTAPPGVLGVHARDGGFHIKAALLDLDRKTYFVAKTNANFPRNAERFGLPTIAAVGADSPEKQELEPALLQGNKIVVDILEQCANIGELHHAIEAGLVKREDVHAELGDVIAGRKAGRASAEEVIIFDSTGTALQDVVAAAIVYERAVSAGAGVRLDFAS